MNDQIELPHVTPASTPGRTTAAGAAVRRRLRPLWLATLLQGMMLWVPVEKLFMSEIGFTPARVGPMAGVYAVVVPLLEIPSGLLADRWSRKGVLMVATVALFAAVAVGAVARNVAVYLVSALFLGVFIAMQSGTADSIIYDTLIEEGGDTDGFDRLLGRLGTLSSSMLIASSLMGGWVASMLSPRWAYALTLPCVAGALVCLAVVREPHVHRNDADGRVTFRAQAAATFSTVLARREVRRVAFAIALCGLLVQMIIEFGPLWLVELRARPASYGPFSAAVFAALWLGGLLAGRVDLHRRLQRRVAGAAVVAACATVVSVRSMLVVTVAFVALAAVCVVTRIELTAQLHAVTASAVRAGVSSSVSTLSFLMFLPLSILFGAVAEAGSVYRGAIVVAVAAGLALCLIESVFGQQNRTALPVADADGQPTMVAVS